MALQRAVSQPKPRLRRRFADFVTKACRNNILAGWVVNVLAYNLRFCSVLLNRFRDAELDYTVEAGSLTRARALRFNDLEANFFIRLILERGYSHVIEIGAYRLERAAGIARLFPSLKTYGLDITKDFLITREVDGVEIGPNTSEQIDEIAARHPRGGLICCRGTLVYYDEPRLRSFFADAFRLGYDLAISEPSTPLEPYMPSSSTRTRRTWYHPFTSILNEAGFQLPDDCGAQIQCSISEYGEERNYIFARHPSGIHDSR